MLIYTDILDKFIKNLINYFLEKLQYIFVVRY